MQKRIQQRFIGPNSKLIQRPQWIFFCLVISFLGVSLSGIVAAASPYDNEPDVLEVLFVRDATMRLIEGMPVDLDGDAYAGVAEVLDLVGEIEWQRMAQEVPIEELNELQEIAEGSLGEELYNFNNAFYLWIPPERDIWAIAEELEALPGIHLAMPVPRPMPLPAIPDFQPNQGYLKNPDGKAPTGIGSYHAWTKAWGDGTSVRICDLEYGWIVNHSDISKLKNASLNPFQATQPYGVDDRNHGAAVAGELVADYNGWGVTGMVKGAQLHTFATSYTYDPKVKAIWRVPEAILLATVILAPGDVILLEQQWENSPGSGKFIPVEFWGAKGGAQTNNAVYAAIKLAVGKGIHVVEAAGNGGENLNTYKWYGDSGAIIVGAGGVSKTNSFDPGDLEKLILSSYGNRVNLQGWGEDIYTAGYGDKHGSNGSTDSFTADFSGTSGASPMVAAAVASCVGYWKLGLLQPANSLTPAMMRSLLINTGTPQIDNSMLPAPIGPRPNLEDAFLALENWAPQVVQWVEVDMPSTTFKTGDNFYLNVKISNNTGTAMGNTKLLVFLDLGGVFFFYPTWTPAPQIGTVNVGTGTQTVVIIPPFKWPAGLGKGYGAKVYATMLDASWQIIGRIGYAEFSWSP